MKDVNLIVSNKIRKKRRDIEMTQKQLADKVGCVASFICEIEKGKKHVSLELLYKIECQLGPIWEYEYKFVYKEPRLRNHPKRLTAKS